MIAVKILYYCAAPGSAPAPEPRQEDTRGPGTPEQAEAHPRGAAAGAEVPPLLARCVVY